MPNNLALSITLGASAGGVVGLFSNIKNAISKCAASTKALSAEHKALGNKIQAAIANRSPASYIAHMTREYDKQAKK
jgi:2'-5' RNA ligase